jgi:Sec-independent protein translocase protein TatA
MFGIGSEELVVIGLLFLVVFGPGKAAGMARDLGHFVTKARDSVEEFKSNLTSSEEIQEAQRSASEFKSELTLDKGRKDDRCRKP